jgi:type IX secretion system PorP/SprF family membrane protein
MIKKISMYIVLLFLTTEITFSQDNTFSNMSASALYLNPALTGVINRDVRVGLIYRSQGSAINNSKPYTTIGAQGDLAFYYNKDKSDFLGFGVNGYRHEEGIAGLKQTNINLSVSYTKGLSSTLSDFLSVGLQGGLSQRAIDYTGLTWDSQWNGQVFQSNVGGEYYDTRNIDFYDFAGGVLFNKKISSIIKFNLGAAVNHALSPKISLNSTPKSLDGKSDVLHRKYTIHGTGEIYTSRNATTLLVPSFIYQWQQTQKNVMLGLDLKFIKGNDSKFTDYIKQSSVSFGLAYRWSDAIIPRVKIDYKEFSFYLAYEATVSKLSTANKSFGSYEFAIVWNLKTEISNNNKPRVFKFIQ